MYVTYIKNKFIYCFLLVLHIFSYIILFIQFIFIYTKKHLGESCVSLLLSSHF